MFQIYFWILIRSLRLKVPDKLVLKIWPFLVLSFVFYVKLSTQCCLLILWTSNHLHSSVFLTSDLNAFFPSIIGSILIFLHFIIIKSFRDMALMNFWRHVSDDFKLKFFVQIQFKAKLTSLWWLLNVQIPLHQLLMFLFS